MRQSLEPTYDSRETGQRFAVESRINGQAIGGGGIPDPFIHNTVVVSFWDAVKAFLFERKLHVQCVVTGDAEIVQDVLELDANYLGVVSSTRRSQFKALVESTLANM